MSGWSARWEEVLAASNSCISSIQTEINGSVGDQARLIFLGKPPHAGDSLHDTAWRRRAYSSARERRGPAGPMLRPLTFLETEWLLETKAPTGDTPWTFYEAMLSVGLIYLRAITSPNYLIASAECEVSRSTCRCVM